MNTKNTYRRIAWLVLIVLAACNQPQKREQQQPIAKPADTTTRRASRPPDSITKTAAATTKTAATAAAAADQQALTLPILDALFYEPDFGAELRSRLGLSAAQIARLRTAAHASVTKLSEDGIPDTESARAASARYEQRIESLIGPDKTQQLLQMVDERYGKGLEGLAPTQPNFVPKDTRIVVNAPAFRMDVFDKGRLIKTYRVGIGYPEFPLPVGMRRADTVIFHPSWTPPDEPWVRGKFAPGRKVSAQSELNPLGVIKIPIGMPSLIHGGKPLDKIGKLCSHGCVGLTNEQVLDLAPIILRLGQSDLSATDARSLERHKAQTKKVKLPVPVPVDLRYETIVAGDGGLHIYRDVYERGTNTPENATAVLGTYGIQLEQLSTQEQGELEDALARMNRDARGRPIATADSPEAAKEVVPPGKTARAKKGKVTTRVIGEKELFVQLPELQGKGYPSPVALNDGRAKRSRARRHNTMRRV